MLCLALLLPLAWAAQADSTCERNDAKGTSLLSLKADAVRSRDTRDIFADVVSTFADNASAANDSNASWQRVNQSLHQSVQDLVTNVMVADVNQTNTVPNPEGNYTDPQNRTGLGKLSQSLEFLYLKVAQLETAVELQSIEYRISKQALDTALVKIQQLEDQLDHKEAQYQQLSAKLSHHQSTSKHGEGELEEPEPVAGNKRYKAWMAAAPRRQKEHETRMGQKAHEVLKDVLLKHHRQSDTKDWHRPAPKAARSSNSSAKSSSEALLQRRSAELDSTVSAKVALGYAAPQLNFLVAKPALRGAGIPLHGTSSSRESTRGTHLNVAFGGMALATLGVVATRRQQRLGTAMRAVTEVAQVKLSKIIGGKATPAPPVGPAIGAFGLNIAFFVKEYNALTADKVGEACPCIVHVMSDKSFKIELKTPLTATLLHKAVGASKGSGKAGTDIIGTITVEKLEEIAKIKLADLNCDDISRAMKIVHGTAVASGIKVEGYEEWLATSVPKPKSIMDRYGPGVSRLPAPWGEGPPLEGADEAEAPEPEPAEA